MDLTDPLLTKWKKYAGNPIKPPGPKPSGPLGCTSAWQEESGNWTTTIQAHMDELPRLGEVLQPEHQRTDVMGGKLRTTFWTSSNFVDWSYVGVLSCPACDLCTQSCSDFYQSPGGPTNRWVFGINTGGCGLRSGGMITGNFDRATLTLTPDRPDWATAVLAGDRSAAQHWAYDYGPFSFPKLSGQDGRRIIYAWLNFNPGAQSDWIGMQSLPREITAAEGDDVTTVMLLNPVAELDALRAQTLASEQGIKLGGSTSAWHNVTAARGTHLDILVTFKGLSALSAADRATFQPAVMVFAGAGSSGHTVSWQAVASEASAGEGGWVNGTAGGGPLALRASQDELFCRVLVDASVVEAFWDGGRARYTAHASMDQEVGGDGVMVGAGAVKVGTISADVEVFKMSSMWLS